MEFRNELNFSSRLTTSLEETTKIQVNVKSIADFVEFLSQFRFQQFVQNSSRGDRYRIVGGQETIPFLLQFCTIPGIILRVASHKVGDKLFPAYNWCFAAINRREE